MTQIQSEDKTVKQLQDFPKLVWAMKKATDAVAPGLETWQRVYDVNDMKHLMYHMQYSGVSHQHVISVRNETQHPVQSSLLKEQKVDKSIEQQSKNTASGSLTGQLLPSRFEGRVDVESSRTSRHAVTEATTLTTTTVPANHTRIISTSQQVFTPIKYQISAPSDLKISVFLLSSKWIVIHHTLRVILGVLMLLYINKLAVEEIIVPWAIICPLCFNLYTKWLWLKVILHTLRIILCILMTLFINKCAVEEIIALWAIICPLCFNLYTEIAVGILVGILEGAVAFCLDEQLVLTLIIWHFRPEGVEGVIVKDIVVKDIFKHLDNYAESEGNAYATVNIQHGYREDAEIIVPHTIDSKIVDLLQTTAQESHLLQRHAQNNQMPTQAQEDNQMPTQAQEDNQIPTQAQEDNQMPTQAQEDNQMPTQAQEDNQMPNQGLEHGRDQIRKRKKKEKRKRQ